VIIAPPPADGGFIGATLLGGQKRSANTGASASDEVAAKDKD
jgi:hypothetical protein